MQQNNSPMPRRRLLSSILAVLICASLVLSSVAVTPTPVRAQSETPTADDSARVNFHQLIIKFKSTTGALTTAPAVELPDLALEPMFPAVLSAGESISAQAATGLSQYFQADLGPDVTFDAAQQTLDALLQNPQVETAYMAPILAPASNLLATPDSYVAQQTYLNQMQVPLVGGPVGSKGADVTLVDIEGGWVVGHEDLPISNENFLPGSVNSSDLDWLNHGTAVLGIIAGRDNTYGITGIAPDTYIRMLSTLGYTSISQAIVAATLALRPGDIILLPVQALGPRTAMSCPAGCDCATFEYIPVEYWQDTFDAITAATAAGIIVVEAAGTGAVNLDNDIYKNSFNRSKRDSGAILVGAGTSDDHSPICSANFGSRLDLQGWGENVVTTGYGDLYQDADSNPASYYTNTFGGSSAAAAMVTGAVSSLQGVAKARGYLLTAEQARDFLRSTGTGQGGDPTAQRIGPFPNLTNALKKISDGVELLSPADNENLYTLRPTFDWENYLGATQYQLIVSNNSTFAPLELNILTTASEYTPIVNLKKGQHYWKVRPALNGVWQNWTSNYRTFSIVSTTIETPRITVVAPKDGTLTGDTTPTFTWKAASSTVTGYEMQLSKDPAFTGVAPIQIAGDDTLSYTPAAALDTNSRYYWRVRSYITTGGNTYQSAWSTRRVFYTTIAITGLDPIIRPDIYENTLRPTFAWNAIPNARAYRVQVSTSATTWTSPYVDATIKPTPTSSDPATSYRRGADMTRSKTLYFRVLVMGAYGWSLPSAAQMFVTPNPPTVPALKTPLHRSVQGSFESGVIFSWLRPSSWRTNPAVSYEMQMATSSNFADGLIEQTFDDDGASTQITEPVDGLAAETAYYWHIRAVGANGISDWSTTRLFFTTPPVPGGLDAGSVDTLRPQLSWERVELARSYQVQVARAIDGVDDPAKIFKGKNVVASQTFVSSPPVTLATTLPRAADLLFRVRSGGIYGYSAWSEPAGFTTPSSPNVPSLSSPGNGSNINTFTPMLDWNNSVKIKKHPETDAVGYQVQIVTAASEFNQPVPATVVDLETDVSQLRLAPDALEKAGTYYWRVRAVNDNGEFSIWSSVRSFTTPAMVSGVVMNALEDAELAGTSLQVNGIALQVQSDANGAYTMRGLMPGTYTLTASANGFMRQLVTFSVSYGTNLTRNFNLVSLPDDGQFRIAVNWNGAPADLDAHLWLPTTNPVHLSKDNLGDIGDDGIRAGVDLTNANGFGPEVITLANNMFPGKYTFAVYMNAAPDYFVNTRARVTVYEGSTFRGEYVVPTTGVGHWWKVFTLDGTTRKLSTIGANFISDSYPASYR